MDYKQMQEEISRIEKQSQEPAEMRKKIINKCKNIFDKLLDIIISVEGIIKDYDIIIIADKLYYAVTGLYLDFDGTGDMHSTKHQLNPIDMNLDYRVCVAFMRLVETNNLLEDITSYIDRRKSEIEKRWDFLSRLEFKAEYSIEE